MLTVSWKPHLGYGPEWLRVAFPCPRLLTASQFWEGVSQEASDRETHPGRNWRDSDELASEVMKHCFYHVLLIKVSLESRGGKADFSFQWEVSKESVAIVNLPQDHDLMKWVERRIWGKEGVRETHKQLKIACTQVDKIGQKKKRKEKKKKSKAFIMMLLVSLLRLTSNFTTYKTKKYKPRDKTGAWQMVLVIKNLLASAGDVRDIGLISGMGRSPGGGHATHSSILAWRIPWTEDPIRLQSTGSQRVGHNWSNITHMHAGIKEQKY